MDPETPAGNVPWMTKEGFFDSTQFPIDSVLKQALSDDDRVVSVGVEHAAAM